MNRETREVVSDTEAGYLGVTCQDVSEEASQYYGLPTGAYIASVEAGGGADQAGIKQGDIITKFDGLSISCASDLKGNIAYYKQGETVEVVYMRANNGTYEEKTVSVTLEKSEKISKQNAEQSQKNGQSALNPEAGLQVPDTNADSEEDANDQEQYFDNSGSIQDYFNQFFGGNSSQSDVMQESTQGHRGI